VNRHMRNWILLLLFLASLGYVVGTELKWWSPGPPAIEIQLPAPEVPMPEDLKEPGDAGKARVRLDDATLRNPSQRRPVCYNAPCRDRRDCPYGCGCYHSRYYRGKRCGLGGADD
jgi:hypothetical protein